jgi:CRP-like cAMP-binding protein
LATTEHNGLLQEVSGIEFLRALPPEEIHNLLPLLQKVHLPAGKRIMEELSTGEEMYFIQEGRTRVERRDTAQTWTVSAGSVIGEAALMTHMPRNASVIAETDLALWKISRADFERVVQSSTAFKEAIDEIISARREGRPLDAPSDLKWLSVARQAIEARYRGWEAWQFLMAVGFVSWVALALGIPQRFLPGGGHGYAAAFVHLVTGLLILQGACEAFLHGCDRLGARLRWDGFISGTVGSLLSTAPEFVVIAFLVKIDPLAAVVTAIVTVFNNGLAFAVYSFFLPKDRKGIYLMPRSLTVAGGELLIAGAAISLVVGLVMVVFHLDGHRSALGAWDLLGIGAVLILIYSFYIASLVKYYAEGRDDDESLPADPGGLGHDTSIGGIARLFVAGVAGSYCGGEAIGAFAETALGRLGLPTIPTAAALAFFAGISEYIIVYKSHRRGELGIALSNVFGGISQVMFLLLPFGLLVTGALSLYTGNPIYVVPISGSTMMLFLLLFPLFYTIHQCVELEQSISNLDAMGMSGIYFLLLYFLFSAPA